MKESFALPLLLAVFLVGGMLSVSSLFVDPSGLVAQTSSYGSTTTGLPTTFSVSVSTETICSADSLARQVAFVADPIVGGYFTVYGAGGVNLGDRLPGTHVFSAGTYTWEGKASAGYVRSGTYTGSFTVGGTCQSTTLIPVTFSPPNVSTTADCSTGVPRTQVTFGISPVSGGYVQVLGDGSARYFDDSNGSNLMGMFPNGTFQWSGYYRPGYTIVPGTVWSGTFSVNNICSSGTQDNSTSVTTTTTSTVTPPTTTTTPPPPPPTSTLTSVTATVSAGASCTLEKNMTQVAVATEPRDGATVVFQKENGNIITSTSQGLIYLPNGTYLWRSEPRPGFTSVGVSSGTFTLSSCPLRVSASVSVGTACDAIEEGVPVDFSVNGEGKAYYVVSDVTTGESLPLQPGREYFPNGSYAWSIVPASGAKVVFDGPASGTFGISACAPKTTTTYVPPKAGTLLFFREGKLIDPIVRQNEKIAVRVDLSGVTSVELERLGKDSREILGKMEKDPGTTRWLFLWNVGTPLPSEYNLVARAKGSSGESVSGSRLVTILPANDAPLPPPVIAQESLPPPLPPSEFPSIGEVTLPEEPVFERFSVDGNGDIPLSLPVRGVADLVSTADILSARNVLPEAIRSPEDLRIFCSTEENDDVCLKLLPERLYDEAKTTLAEARKEIDRAFAERPTRTADADSDGVADFDEVHFFGTDPQKPDTDGDGKGDAEELLATENPLERGAAPKKLTFENPSFGGDEKPDLFTVADVRVLPDTTTDEDPKKEKVLPITLSGSALPGSIVTLYVYSDPIIVRVKADESGLWSYTLTRELPDGSHKAYVAMTDSAGRVLAKSAPLPFVKQASAVSVTPSALPGIGDSAPSLFSGASLYAIVLITLGVLGFAFLAIGVVVRGRKEENVIP